MASQTPVSARIRVGSQTNASPLMHIAVPLLDARQAVVIAFAPDQRPAFMALKLLHSANQDEMISGFDNLVK